MANAQSNHDIHDNDNNISLKNLIFIQHQFVLMECKIIL